MLEHYDPQRSNEIIVKIKNKNDKNFLVEGLLCRVSKEDFDNFEKNGKGSANIIAFFMGYIYNFDLLAEMPLLPYFILGFQDGDKVAYYESVNE